MGLGTGDGVGRSCAWGCVYAIVKTVKQSNPPKGAPSRNTTELCSDVFMYSHRAHKCRAVHVTVNVDCTTLACELDGVVHPI